MSFDVAAEAYEAFMGRWSRQLCRPFLERSGLRPGHRALDVGCGPGILTDPLVDLLGAGRVSAVDPSEPFVTAARSRHPAVDVRQGSAEALPFEDELFDATLAQLVVHFMSDPVGGFREMTRVTRPGGVVLASVWDFGGGRGPLSTFWRVALELDPGATDESRLPGARAGHLVELAESAGLVDLEPFELTVSLHVGSFEEWWTPYTRGVGPAGSYVAGLTPEAREALVARLRDVLPEPPFDDTATAWGVRGRRNM